MSDFDYDFEKDIERAKLSAFRDALSHEEKALRVKRFFNYLKGKFWTGKLFDEGSPWKIEPNFGSGYGQGIEITINKSVGCMEMTEDMLMSCLEKVFSSFKNEFDCEWRLVTQETWMLRFITSVEYDGESFAIDMQYYGDNPSCEKKTRKVWKEVEESYLDCGMEREEEPSPFIGPDGLPVRG